MPLNIDFTHGPTIPTPPTTQTNQSTQTTPITDVEDPHFTLLTNLSNYQPQTQTHTTVTPTLQTRLEQLNGRITDDDRRAAEEQIAIYDEMKEELDKTGRIIWREVEKAREDMDATIRALREMVERLRELEERLSKWEAGLRRILEEEEERVVDDWEF